jgi:PAS domain S-box-containing protein
MMEPATQPSSPRQRERYLRALAVVLLLVTLTMTVLAALNFGQRTRYVPVWDGVQWDVTPDGVLASLVIFGSPANRSGIRAGDILLSINGTPVQNLTDVSKSLFRSKPGTALRYELQRPDVASSVRTVQVTVIPVQEIDPFSLRGFLEFVAILYLGIGLFVLFKRWSAPHALHFYVFCLISFIVYSFSYTGRLNTFDWAIYWVDAVALLLQPALFLHFALAFPEPKPWFRQRPWTFAALYVSAAGLLTYHVLAVGMGLVPASLEELETLDRTEMAHVALLFLLAACVFEYTYRTTREPTLVQQLKWVTRGTWLAILPFTAFYVMPLFMDEPPSDWMKLSTLSLIFIPLTFGYAIIRYRLMDVDLIFRRGVAYTLATAVVAALYFGVAVTVAELFHTNLSFGTGGVVIAIIIAAVLFPPLKDWTEMQLERLFYRERFDYRQTLEDFARELASEIDLDRLLGRLLDRLSATLPAHRLAIFLAEEEEEGVFRLARGLGAFPADIHVNLSAVIKAAGSGYAFLDTGQTMSGLADKDREKLDALGLHYFIPCRVQNRAIGLLGLSKTQEGNFLNSEDIELVQTLANYLSVALENARLYRDLENKAEQVAQLKDFSENILESSSVGLVALSTEDRIESWNSSMERLTGIARSRALNQPLGNIFPSDFVAAIAARRDSVHTSSIYKFEIPRPSKSPALTNISFAPLISKDGASIGRLLVFDDITERVQLEQQVLQTEKLTSLGLLAAGVAHEVNTPLAVISNYAQMLAKQFGTEDGRSDLVEKIVKQTFRASEIVSGLLNFSRTGTGEFDSVNLNDALKETLSLLEHQLSGQGITVVDELAEELPTIYGDYGKLQQVFLNLVLNARDAMPQGGSVTLRSRANGQRVLVEIADTGAGIPQDDLDKIFDPFFTTKTTGQGTGLGLAVTYGIIKEHHGTIQANSAPGRGTTFVLEFPVLAAVAARQETTNA